MEQERKYFADPQSGGGNFDDASFAIGINEYVNKENCRSGSTDAGFTGTIESIGSTVRLTEPQPSVTYLILGSEQDNVNNRILMFHYNLYSSEHKITCWYINTQTEYLVLLSSQVDGGLDLDKDFPIHSVRIIGNLLYWTDNTNEPKKINIDKAIKANDPSFVTTETAYTLPMVYPTQTIIKRPPYYSLTATKNTDGGFVNNYTALEAFQMTYYYGFIDYETSRLAAYSALCNFNTTEGQSFNSVLCVLPFAEPIDDDVQLIHICAKFGNTGETVIVKTFDKAIAADNALIVAHNAGVAQLSFTFYNNEIYVGVDDVQSNTPFDSVPLKSEGLENTDNRLFLANNLSGYDTPTDTSLSATVVTVGGGGGGPYSGEWGYVTLQANLSGTTQNDYMYPFVYVPTAPLAFYYFPAARVNNAWNGGTWTPDLLSDVNINDATIGAADEASFVAALKVFMYPSVTPPVTVGFPTWLAPYTVDYNFFSVVYPVNVIESTPSSVSNFLKSGGSYKLSIQFLDRFRRKCGAVNTNVQCIIPNRVYTQVTFSTSIQWAVSNTLAINEIPDWAYYYQILITKNLTTRFFVDGQVIEAFYAVKEQDGTFTYTDTTLDTETQYGVAFNITPLTALGLGYVFTEGDEITVYLSDDTTITNLTVLAQDGNYVIFSLTDVGDTSAGIVASYELFTPYRSLSTEPYYETPTVYEVYNPTTDNRAYSVTSDIIVGDTYNIERELDSEIFIAEAMSPNDLRWQIWNTATGWPNFVTSLGQARHKNQIRYSNTYIAGTQINGLSTFESLSARNTPQEAGEIWKIILTSKTAEAGQGNVMLAIHTLETASIYLGETQTYGSNSPSTLVISEGVIGTINILKGNYGTLDPTSVCEYRGLVFWFDALNGRVIQYAGNGLFAISDYKMVTYWKLFSKQYLSMTKAEIEALGSRPFVYAAVDPSHNELLLSVPKLLETPPYGYLPDYPEIIYPFNIWDGQAKCLVYHIAAEPNFWGGSYPYTVEGFATAQNKLYLFKYGQLYAANQTDSQCNIFGIQYKPKVMCVSNMLPPKPKVYENMAIEANMKPTFIYLYNNYPYQQASDIYDIDFREKEGVFYAPVLRNKLVPTEDGFTTDGLLTSEKMRNVAMFIMLEFTVSTTPLELKFLYIGFAISKGASVQ